MKELSKTEMKKLYQYLTGEEAPKESVKDLRYKVINKLVEAINKNRQPRDCFASIGKATELLDSIYNSYSRYKTCSLVELIEKFDLYDDYVDILGSATYYSIQFTKKIKLDDHRRIEVEFYITYANTYIMGYALHNI